MLNNLHTILNTGISVIKYLFIGVFIYFISGCGDNEETKNSSASLTGFWQSPCTDAPKNLYKRGGYRFLENNRVSFEMDFYEDKGCRKKLLEETDMKITGRYSVGDRLDNVDGAYRIDLHFSEISILNKEKIEKNINVYDVYYIDTNSGNIDKLFLGKTSSEFDGSSAAKRKKEIYLGQFYTRNKKEGGKKNGGSGNSSYADDYVEDWTPYSEPPMPCLYKMGLC